MKDNCSDHKKDLFGKKDMKVVADAIGNLHYHSLKHLLKNLSDKIYLDAVKDSRGGREHLAMVLGEAASHLNNASKHITRAWQISKPFMKTSQP